LPAPASNGPKHRFSEAFCLPWHPVGLPLASPFSKTPAREATARTMNQPSPEPTRPDEGPATTPSNPQWFYVQHGETYGPVSSVDLRAAAHLGFVGPHDMIRRSDRIEWVPAHSLRGLFKQADSP